MLRFVATRKDRSVPELDVTMSDPKKYSTSFMISKSSATIWPPLAT
jgi:hypothetical protein